MARRIMVNTAKEATAMATRLYEQGYIRRKGRTFKHGGWTVYEKDGEAVVVAYGAGNYTLPQV